MTGRQLGRGLAIVLTLAGCAAAPVARIPGAWLDAPLAGWNRPGAPVPAAPPPQGDPPALGRCRDAVRAAVTAEDRAVAGAGWTLVGPVQARAGATIVLGMTSVDGMCRPLGFQSFVFTDGRFAGTLSPVVMNSRTDGAQARTQVVSPTEVVAEFVRYRDADALCCPSRVSRVTYRIDRAGGRADGDPVLVPVVVTTESPR